MFIDLGQGIYDSSELAVLSVGHMKTLCERYGIDILLSSGIYKLAKCLLDGRMMFTQPDQPATYPEILKEVFISFQLLAKQTIQANTLKLSLSAPGTSQVSA